MAVITRFAPSPTGYLHVGNIRTALVNWLYARNHNGKFILRIDDTDTERSKQEYVDGIMRDLEWLGLTWDAVYYQSKRMDMYEAAKEKMIKSGRLYDCYESTEELEVKKKTLLSRNLPPIYDRSALRLTVEQKKELSATKRPHWRFMLNEKPIKWNDGVRGEMSFDPKNMSDPILVRENGTMTYMIASVVDDIDLEITDIIRGEDHITNSAVHIQMFEALGSPLIPHFSHLSRIRSKEGEISKRYGGFDVASLRETGIQPLTILSFLAKLGTSDPIECFKTHDELIKSFDIGKFSKAPSTYDVTDLERLNTKLVHSLSFAEIKDQLKNSAIDEHFWLQVRANLKTVADVEVWWNICKENVTPEIMDKDFNSKLMEILPPEPWSEETFNVWVNEAKNKLNKSGQDLYMPIRLSLTALKHGPELKKLLPLLGRDKVIGRLQGKAC